MMGWGSKYSASLFSASLVIAFAVTIIGCTPKFRTSSTQSETGDNTTDFYGMWSTPCEEDGAYGIYYKLTSTMNSRLAVSTFEHYSDVNCESLEIVEVIFSEVELPDGLSYDTVLPFDYTVQSAYLIPLTEDGVNLLASEYSITADIGFPYPALNSPRFGIASGTTLYATLFF